MRGILYLIPGEKKAAWLTSAMYLEKQFGFVHIYSIDDLRKYYNEKFTDILIPYNFNICGQLKAKDQFLDHQCKNGSKLWYLRNEYDLSIMTFLRKLSDKYGIHCLVNHERPKTKIPNVMSWHLVNLNCLTYVERMQHKNTNPEPVYWGTYRRGRVKYFREYLPHCVWSTGKKSFLKKGDLEAKRIVRPVNIRDLDCVLGDYRFTVYLEDTDTHTNYNFPANRFYESLSMGIVQFFDQNTVNTWNRYGIDVSKFIVTGGADFKRRVESTDYRKAWKEQSKWIDRARQDQKELHQKLVQIFP